MNKKTQFFQQSDGWVFSTIYGWKKLDLDRLISTGNTLNHAIFSLAEINEGLSRLESEGFIEVRQLHIIFTEKAKLFEKQNKKHFEGCIDKQVRYSGIFSNMPLTHEVVYKTYFNSEEYEVLMKKNINN